MTEALLPEDIIVTIDGVVFTQSLFSFSENGGEKNRYITKTLRGNRKIGRASPNDYNIEFGGTVTTNSFNNRFKDDESQTISVAWTGSFTITYNNALIDKVNYNVNSDDRLIATMSFVVPYYNTNGSLNRVIT